jgi:hypothetical protein
MQSIAARFQQTQVTLPIMANQQNLLLLRYYKQVFCMGSVTHDTVVGFKAFDSEARAQGLQARALE